MTKRVLVIGMLDSIHLARWLSNFEGADVEITLFPSTSSRRIHAEILRLCNPQNQEAATFRIIKTWKVATFFLSPIQYFFKIELRQLLLLRKFSRRRYHFIHAFEFQHAGYLLLKIKKLLPKEPRPQIVLSNWGSDIYWFQRFKKHKAKITELLEIADYYACECQRDVLLARKLGFAGKILDVLPNSGGIQLPAFSELRGRFDRDSIAVKGYHGWAGRALRVLEALELEPEFFEDMKVVIFSADKATMQKAKKMGSQFDITTHPKGALDHREVGQIMSRSSVYVGVSATDGISTSMLEAMAHGAIPVQTNTSCCEEWIIHGETGVALSSFDPCSILNAIKYAFSLAEDDGARLRNYTRVKQKAEFLMIRDKLRNFYSDL